MENDGYCNGGDLPGMIRVGNTIYFQNNEWYEFVGDEELKERALKEKNDIGRIMGI